MSPFLRILHVGGRQDYIGPATALLEAMGASIELTVCDADPSIDSAGLAKEFADRYRTTLVTKPFCIAAQSGPALFFTTKKPDASSLRMLDVERRFYHRETTWGEDCAPTGVTVLETHTIPVLVASVTISAPDVLSLDIQGVEYEVLASSLGALPGLVAVITEAEFRPLYKDQKLFSDIDQLMRSWGFVLADLFNQDRWHPHCDYPMGVGFITVAEPLYLRDYRCFLPPRAPANMLALTHLIAVSAAFYQLSYAYEVLRAAQAYDRDALYGALAMSSCSYLHKAVHILDNKLTLEADVDS